MPVLGPPLNAPLGVFKARPEPFELVHKACLNSAPGGFGVPKWALERGRPGIGCDSEHALPSADARPVPPAVL